MTRISSKLTAVLIATVTIGGAVISSTEDASARMRGERMGMGRMHHGHGHIHRHGHGFGRAMAIGAGIGIAGALIAHAAAPRVVYAESFDPRTGVRVRSEKRGKDRVVTKTDANGNVSREVKKPNEPASASSTDTNTGETTSVIDNQNGTRTITKTDGKGNVTEKRVENNKQPSSASSTDPSTGVTTTSISNGNGTRTVVTTDASGKVLSSEVVR